MNILFTAAGRRSYLIRYFKKALMGRGNVIVANSIADSPAMLVADRSYLVPYIYEKDYIEKILEICKKEKISLLFSLHDLDGWFLSKHKADFERDGTLFVGADFDFTNICLDKYKSYRYLNEHSILTPKTYLKPEEYFENNTKVVSVIIKPRWGFGSNNIMTADTKEEINFIYHYFEKRKNKKLINFLGYDDDEPSTIIQELIKGNEFGNSIIHDINNKYLGQLIIQKLAMRSGETDSAIPIKNLSIEKIGKKISSLSKHKGVLDCDMFFNGTDYFVLEMNPRFGGQYPFSHVSGANVPDILINNSRLANVKEKSKSCKIVDILSYE